MAEFASQYKEVFEAWKSGSNYLCCLAVDTKQELDILYGILSSKYKCSYFREPDIKNQITAIAVEPLDSDQHITEFGNLKLALS